MKVLVSDNLGDIGIKMFQEEPGDRGGCQNRIGA